ncbi:MAG: molybdopterin-dependent oxidoreductase [Dehalococcoidia bacterium]|nr:molybdopterin-dependent oxidoreductase [Dehalococcoidia bacterium]
MGNFTKHTLPEQEVVRDGACYMCGDYCPTKIHVRQGKAVHIDMLDQRIAEICPRWKAQLDFVYHPDRLKHPLKRVSDRGTGAFVRISWDEALDTIASKLQKAKTEYGAESVVFYVAYTKEPRPYFRRLTHAFGSPNYCTETSSCFSSGWLAASLNYGQDYGYFLVNSMMIDPATKCKLIWSSSVMNSSPRLWQDYLDAKQRGMRLIVVDPRRTKIASMADIYLQLRPGTDGALALGLMNVIINEQLYDKEFVEKWTVGFDDLKKLVQEYPPEKVEQITWVSADKVREAAILFATQKPAKIRTSPGATLHHHNGVQTTRAILLLSALTGNFEVPGGNQKSPDFPPTNDITLKERVANLPPGLGSDRFPLFTDMYGEMQSNVLADRIESGNPYPIKALFAAGLNLQFFPNYNRLVEHLKKLDMIVDTDYFHTPATHLADIVLPISSWLERHILVTTPAAPGLIRLIEPAIEPVEESWPEWKIFSELAKRLGFGHEFWDGDIEKCFSYILEPTGITLKELREHPEGIQYPQSPRPAKSYEKAGFQTPSGKVEISSSILAKYGYEPLPVYKEPMESPVSRPDLTQSFPLVLTSGARTIYFTHSQHRNIPQLRKMVPEPLLEINPSDAEPRGIHSGDKVTVSSPRGSIELRANVTDTILSGVVHIPHHWPGKANVNILTDDRHLDPISGFPAFKSQPCQVTKS